MRQMQRPRARPVPHMAAGESDRGVWCQCRVDALCCVSAVAAANQGGRPVSDSEMVPLSTADRRLIVSALWWVRQTQPTTPMAVEMEALMGRLEAADE